MLIITTHFWGDKYSPEYVRKLYRGVSRNLKIPFRFLVVTTKPSEFKDDSFQKVPLVDDRGLLKIPGCTIRLRMFDPVWQAFAGIAYGDTIVSLDIDLIITGLLDPLFQRPENFVIVQDVNTSNPCPYCGTMFMFKAGAHDDVWRDYSPDANLRVPYFSFPDDQGWFHHKIPKAGAWRADDGVYAFHKRGWPPGNDLPSNARVVAFPGWRDPGLSKFNTLPWIQKHWR